MTTAEYTVSDEERLLASLRPTTLSEFIGQDQLKAGLAISMQSARLRRQSLDHVLLYGPKGLGKTTLAGVIAHEMGGNFVRAIGTNLEKKSDLIRILGDLEDGDVFFIDEIHSLSNELQEILYTAMEDFHVDCVVDSAVFPVDLAKFTLIGATTRKGSLNDPLIDRFGLEFSLVFYDTAALTDIVRRSALLLGISVNEIAASEIARRSRGTPRVANKLLRRVRDYALVVGVDHVRSHEVKCAMDIAHVDEDGLDDTDRNYLSKLLRVYKGGPAGERALASAAQEDVKTLTETVEPYLLHRELIFRTPRGRVLTDLGREVAERTAVGLKS